MKPAFEYVKTASSLRFKDGHWPSQLLGDSGNPWVLFRLNWAECAGSPTVRTLSAEYVDPIHGLVLLIINDL